jgi:hypothetical protein
MAGVKGRWTMNCTDGSTYGDLLMPRWCSVAKLSGPTRTRCGGRRWVGNGSTRFWMRGWRRRITKDLGLTVE